MLGNVTWGDLVRDIVGTRSPSHDTLRCIWQQFASWFGHVANNGSPINAVAARESLLQRFYSYSFGSCLDVNSMLAAALSSAGFTVYLLRSDNHVAVEVRAPDGVYYADADLNILAEGTIETLVASGSEPFVHLRGATREHVPADESAVSWSFFPFDELLFTLRRPRLLFRPIDPLNPFNRNGLDVYYRLRARNTCVGEAKLALAPRVIASGSNGTGTWSDIEIASPYVILSARIPDLPHDWRVSLLHLLPERPVDPEIPLRPPDFRFDPLVVWLAGDISRADMRTNWGGYARRANLTAIADRVVTDSHPPVAESSDDFWLQLFEDETRLGPMIHDRDPVGPHRSQPSNRRIIEDGHGLYRLYQQDHLVFSSADGSDPVTNGRRYWYRVRDASMSVRGRYRFVFRVYHRGEIPRTARVHVRFQYNQAVMPPWSRVHLASDVEGMTMSTRIHAHD